MFSYRFVLYFRFLKIVIKSTNFELTPALKDYVGLKLGRLKKLLVKMERDQEFLLRVEIGKTTRHHKKGNIFYAEANLDIGNNVLRAESENWNTRLAINEVHRELERRISKFKGKSRQI